MPTTAASLTRTVAWHAASTPGWSPVIWVVLGGTFLVRAAGFIYPFLALHLQTDLHLSRI
ncbi:hypothetical protein [Streptomyces decoyicus]